MNTNENEKIYITYGICKFEKNKFLIKRNKPIIDFIGKPKDAFWASPVDAKFGWKDWCMREKFGELHAGDENVDYVKWKFKPNTKIFLIKSFTDLINLPTVKCEMGFSGVRIDFNELRKMGYSGVELSMDEHYFGHFSEPNEDEFYEILKIKGIKESDNEKIDRLFKELFDLETSLNTWDCDSVCIWDSKCIDVVEEKHYERPNYYYVDIER